MEQDSDFLIKGRIEWRTKVPSPETPYFNSPAFMLSGSEWRLRISKEDDDYLQDIEDELQDDEEDDSAFNYGLVVSLIPKRFKGHEDFLQTPFSVWTYIGHPMDPSETLVAGEWREITRRKLSYLWNPDPYAMDDTSFSKMDDLFESGEVRIVCLFYDADPTPTRESDNLDDKSVQVSSEVPRDIESLSSDFSLLLEKEILPDVKLVGEGRTFQAHRSVLVARSEVFKAMFQNGTLESKTGAVRIPDIRVCVLEKMLKFVYNGKPEDISEGTAAPLYEAADKYAVHSLKSACAYWIQRNLTIENCVKYLVVADSHSDRNLKAAVISFITENPSVLKSEPWRTFLKKPSELANEVFQAFIASTVH